MIGRLPNLPCLSCGEPLFDHNSDEVRHCLYKLSEEIEEVPEASKVIQMKVELLDEILACKNPGQILPILRRALESALKAQKEVKTSQEEYD